MGLCLGNNEWGERDSLDCNVLLGHQIRFRLRGLFVYHCTEPKLLIYPSPTETQQEGFPAASTSLGMSSASLHRVAGQQNCSKALMWH